MASRMFQFQYSYERDLAQLDLKINIGASGAPTVNLGKGLTSITRNSAGNYTLVLKDVHNKLMGVSAAFISGASAPAAPAINVVSEAVNTVGTQTVVIQCRNAAGAATDPASGEVMLLQILCRDAST